MQVEGEFRAQVIHLLVNDALNIAFVILARAGFHFLKNLRSAVAGGLLQIFFDGADVLLDLGAPVATFDDEFLGAPLEAFYLSVQERGQDCA